MGIIAVSDVHLGYMNASKMESFSDKKSFVSFLDGLAGRDDITDFVICGDLLDMWRRDMVGVTIENLDILSRFQKLASKMKVHYMAGNHDYHIRYLTRFPYPFGFTECIDPRKGIALQDGGKTFLFKHGYDFEPLCRRASASLTSSAAPATKLANLNLGCTKLFRISMQLEGRILKLL